MLESMEGRRGMPRLRPPFPAQFGYLGRPTLINNVETLAHVARILRGDWQPTRLWSVSGAVAKPGCYEAPLDITLRSLLDDYAGGLTAEPGAIVPGGAASGILPPAALDVPLTRDGLAEWGCGVGSAAVQVFPASYSPLRLLARDDAVLRRGVVPEMHSVPDRQPGPPPRRRGARARPRTDDTQPGRGVARGDGGDLDLRSRPGRADPGPECVPALARAVRSSGRCRLGPDGMTLRLIGAGFPRTGTRSLGLALEQLLGGRCYHMHEVFENLDHVPVWRQALRGDMPDWNEFLGSYVAAVDWPASAFWRAARRGESRCDRRADAARRRGHMVAERKRNHPRSRTQGRTSRVRRLAGPLPRAPASTYRRAVGRRSDGDGGVRAATIADVRAGVPAPSASSSGGRRTAGRPICRALDVPGPARSFPARQHDRRVDGERRGQSRHAASGTSATRVARQMTRARRAALIVVLLGSASVLAAGNARGNREAVSPAQTVTSKDGGLTVSVPRGALSKPTRIRVRTLTQAQYPPELRNATVRPGSKLYALEPSGLRFLKPVTITRRIDTRVAGFEKDTVQGVVLASRDRSGKWELLEPEPDRRLNGRTLVRQRDDPPLLDAALARRGLQPGAAAARGRGCGGRQVARARRLEDRQPPPPRHDLDRHRRNAVERRAARSAWATT